MDTKLTYAQPLVAILLAAVPCSTYAECIPIAETYGAGMECKIKSGDYSGFVFKTVVCAGEERACATDEVVNDSYESGEQGCDFLVTGESDCTDALWYCNNVSCYGRGNRAEDCCLNGGGSSGGGSSGGGSSGGGSSGGGSSGGGSSGGGSSGGGSSGGESSGGGSSDATRPNPPRCDACDYQCTGSDSLVADPINIRTQKTYLRNVDYAIRTSAGEVNLSHTYVSDDESWTADGMKSDGTPLLRLVPKPFGSSPYKEGSLRWWHNYFSFVLEAKTTQPALIVRDTDGHSIAYKAAYDPTTLVLDACAGLNRCFAVPAAGGEYPDEMLEVRQISGPDDPRLAQHKYSLWKKGGERFEYTKRWMRNDVDIYFLEHIYNANGELVASVFYENPGLPWENCQQGAEQGIPPPMWFDCDSGAPFVKEVQAANGGRLTFHYSPLVFSIPPLHAITRTEWVLTEVDLEGPGEVGEPSRWVVRYTYRNNTPGEIETIETRSSTTETQIEKTRIQYTPSFAVFRQNERDSYKTSEHQYDSADPRANVIQANSPEEIVSVGPGSAGGLQVTDTFGYDGFGSVGTISRIYFSSKNPGQLSGGWTDIQEVCEPPEACSAGTVMRWRDPTTGWIQEEIDKAGHKVHYDYEHRAGWIYEAAVTTSRPESTNPPAAETIAYNHDSSNPQLHRVASKTRAGLYGGESGVQYAYDDQGRVTREIRSGSTATDFGAIGQRYVATFYSYSTAGSSAPNQKYLRVAGPCEVDSPTVEECGGSAPYPVTETVYFSASDSKPRQNQPMEVRRSSGDAGEFILVTKYVDYDATGNVLEEVDENGHSISYEYLPGTHLLTKKTVSTETGPAITEFGYDFGHRIWTKFPTSANGSAAYEVECYRENTVGPCSGGKLTDVIQWKAKASDALGAQWSEKVVFDYWKDPTGTVVQSVKSEAYYSPTGLRRVKKYGADLQRRTVREASGGPLNDALIAEYQMVRAYDHADHMKALGLPYNEPPKYCQSNGRMSTACSAIAYDDADRLQSVTEYPDGSNPVTTCFERDMHGNISKLAFGCTSACEDCLANTSAAASYAYDDFGNVISAALPNMAGELRFVYNVQGQVTKRDSPTLRMAGAYYETIFDGLGRALSHTSRSFSDDNAISLWVASFDRTLAPCPAGVNTLGRLAQRTDSFGTTCYSYDAEGRIKKEERYRANPTCNGECVNDTLTTEYAYDLSGNIAYIAYPHGRKVWYDYYSDTGRDNRIKAVRVSLPGSEAMGKEILRNIVWEPYGSVSSYALVNPENDSEARVEYLLGEAGTRDATTTQYCGYARPSTNDYSGRLRAIWVSKTGDGDVYRRAYSWKADQIVGQDTCVASNDAATPASRERFEYDHGLRLTGAEDLGVGKRTYSYDARGNRTSESNWVRTMTSTLWGDAMPDQLTSVAAPPAGEELWQLAYSYDYDADGRVSAIHSPPYLSSAPSGLTDVKMEFGYGDASIGGIDAVFSSVTLSNAFDGGATYNYYYDAQNRRWRKLYPTLKADEFFYDSGHLLLEDRGNDALASQVPVYPIDEYVWLDGRPVAFLRSNFDANWNRLNDLTGSCKRNGEEAACGLYFLVTDHIGKPAVVLDSQHRISGAAVEEDPFGEVNSRPLAGDTHHPMMEGDAGPLATIDLGPSPTLQRQVRVKFALVDSPPDAVTFQDSSGVALSRGRLGKPYAGPRWSDWVDVPAAGGGKVVVSAAAGLEESLGVSAEKLEFRIRTSGASYSWPGIRFPGQYADAETGLYENWHRHYDSTTGRYLQVEPFLENPARVIQAVVEAGIVPAAYSYANDNPRMFIDADGNCPWCFYVLVAGLLIDLKNDDEGWDPQGSAGPALQILGTFGAASAVRQGVCLGAAKAAAAKAPATVQANRAAGNAFRDELADALRASGRDVATEVYKKTPFGKRFVDIEVSQNGTVLGGVEAKVGASRYHATQRAKDAWLWLMESYRVNVVRRP